MAVCPRVEILLATYNGAAFLAQQLESFCAQTLAPWSVLVRDDGSTDATRAIVDSYRERLPIKWLDGGHVGVRRAFFDLLAHTAPEADFVAFADQDDVWLPDKLDRATRALNARPTVHPVLYCARAQLTDAALQPIGMTRLPRHGASFANALIENIASGNTILLNRTAIDLLNHEHPSAPMPIHDWWAYQAVAGCGEVIYDPTPALLYRQHGANTIGVNANPVRALIDRAARQLDGRNIGVISAQAGELRRIFADRLKPVALATLDRFLQNRNRLVDRLQYVLTTDLHRQAGIDDWAFRLLFLMGRI